MQCDLCGRDVDDGLFSVAGVQGCEDCKEHYEQPQHTPEPSLSLEDLDEDTIDCIVDFAPNFLRKVQIATELLQGALPSSPIGDLAAATGNGEGWRPSPPTLNNTLPFVHQRLARAFTLLQSALQEDVSYIPDSDDAEDAAFQASGSTLTGDLQQDYPELLPDSSQ